MQEGFSTPSFLFFFLCKSRINHETANAVFMTEQAAEMILKSIGYTPPFFILVRSSTGKPAYLICCELY